MSATAVQPRVSAEFATTFRDMLLGRLVKENATTRRVIRNVPEDKKDYKPHGNCRSAWELACHIVSSDLWFLNGVADHNFAWTGEPTPPADNVAGLVSYYEEQFKKAAERVNAMTAEQLLQPVDFFGIMNEPAFTYLQFAQDHTVHHRGQLSTYLRPMGAKVPDIYGGSFDEPFTGS
jgi:uncharacterized damage-inducible protein DinB